MFEQLLPGWSCYAKRVWSLQGAGLGWWKQVTGASASMSVLASGSSLSVLLPGRFPYEDFWYLPPLPWAEPLSQPCLSPPSSAGMPLTREHKSLLQQVASVRIWSQLKNSNYHWTKVLW